MRHTGDGGSDAFLSTRRSFIDIFLPGTSTLPTAGFLNPKAVAFSQCLLGSPGARKTLSSLASESHT